MEESQTDQSSILNQSNTTEWTEDQLKKFKLHKLKNILRERNLPITKDKKMYKIQRILADIALSESIADHQECNELLKAKIATVKKPIYRYDCNQENETRFDNIEDANIKMGYTSTTVKGRNAGIIGTKDSKIGIALKQGHAFDDWLWKLPGERYTSPRIEGGNASLNNKYIILDFDGINYDNVVFSIGYGFVIVEETYGRLKMKDSAIFLDEIKMQ
ncbi:MAG: hypothetical protein JKX76_02650 [Colwellia sp.]|nr:hypothetical protein [Colwellia sp.]